MVTNGMHRNLGKSNSILRSQSVGIICQKGDSLSKKKRRSDYEHVHGVHFYL